MDLRDREYEVVAWVLLAQGRDLWRSLLNMKINFQV